MVAGAGVLAFGAKVYLAKRTEGAAKAAEAEAKTTADTVTAAKERSGSSVMSGEPEVRRRADPSREEFAAKWMATGLCAEEWAARNAENILCFSFDEYRYADPALNAFVQEVGRIFFTPGGVDAARRRFMTDEEIGRAEERESAPF